MNFLTIFDSTWTQLQELILEISESLRSSLCPDSPAEYFVSKEFGSGARECIAILSILPLVTPGTRTYFHISHLRQHFGNMVQNYRGEGDWKILGEILKITDSLSVYDTWTTIFNYMSEEDWFGNFVPLMEQAVKSMRVRKLYPSPLNDTRPVIRPIRKSGYNDKGSWTPDSLGSLRAKPAVQKYQIVIAEPPAFAWFKFYQLE